MKQIAAGMFFSEFRSYTVFDKDQQKIGIIGDFIFDLKNRTIESLIVYGNFLEEKLEALHIIDNRDEIIPLDLINREKLEYNKLPLNVVRDLLQTTNTKWEPKKDFILFSKLKTVKVLDFEEKFIGYTTDIMFHRDGTISLVIDPGQGLKHLIGHLYKRVNHDFIISGHDIKEITISKISLNINRNQVEQDKTLPVLSIITKNRKNFEISTEAFTKRYRYYVLETEISNALKAIKVKEKKIKKPDEMLTYMKMKTDKDELINQFLFLFNEISVSGVDPYTEMTKEEVQQHFADKSHLTYLYGKPAGYFILKTEETDTKKTLVIAGIGIHPKHRGKRFSSAMLAHAISHAQKENYTHLQCDILSSNEASLRLFKGFGFTEKDTFFL